MAEADLPEGFEAWPADIQSRYLEELHALYFPKLRWWEKPETDEEDSGPRPKQLPPDHPRHSEPDNRGYRCGCSHGIPDCQECPPCPGDPNWAIWVNLTGRGTGKTKAGSNWTIEMALSKCDIHVGVCAPTYEDVRAVCIEGEALALDTYVPTPSGHTTMGEIKPGDIVLGGDGSPCRVTAAFAPLAGRDCYRVTFKGGAEVIADGEHKWLVSTYLDRVARRHGRPRERRVITTAEMANSVRYEKMRGVARNYGVPVAKASYSDEFAMLMIDPYVLGYWLGDGTAKSGDITTMDPEVLAEIANAGYDIVQRPDKGDHGRAHTYGIYKLWRHLRLAGLLRNKHVPDEYMRASAAERLALVQGLMDSDGYVSERGQCEFVNKNKALADALVDLLCGLGIKASAPHPKTSWVGTTHWLVKFTTTEPVFRIPRKRARIPARYRDAAEWVIWSIEPVPSVPVRCISVDSPDRTYLVTRHHIATHNSGIIAEARRNGLEITDYNKNRQEITLPNGSKIRGFSAEKPDSIRGQNLSYVWFDELAMIRYFTFYHEGLMPALRKGERPRMMITTTPKRVRLIRELVDESKLEFEGLDGEPGTGVHLTEAISAENIHFSRMQRERLERKYKGTHLLAQELEGKLLGDIDGSLFPIEQFNETRVFPDKDALPQWRRIVVAIDPATTSRESSDESGIIVMAEGDDGDFYCLEDCSGRFPPDQQMRVVAEAYYRHSADCVVGEVNMTGDYMRALLNTVDSGSNIPLRSVHGMRGKVSRAQGPSSLFAQGRIHHVGDNFRQLEDQLSAMAEGDDRSRMHDDRADAWVWSMLHLAGSGQGDWGLVYGFRDCTGCGARINEDKDRACHECGRPIEPMTPKHAGGRPTQVPWSAAYLKTCPKCEKTYTPRERTCPHCSPNPETYLARALASANGSGGRYGYTPRDWFAGRKF